jgi:hypothetical protein
MMTDKAPSMQGGHTEVDNYRRIRKPRVSEPLNAHLMEAFHKRQKDFKPQHIGLQVPFVWISKYRKRFYSLV